MVDSNNSQKLIEHLEKAGVVANTVNIGNFLSGRANAQNEPRTGISNNARRVRTIEFVGRSKELTDIHEYLLQSRRVPAIALCGTGGIGKTELALQYIHEHEGTYSAGICWLNARDADISTQLLSYVRIYLGLKPPKDLGIQQQLEFCWANWQAGNALLVFDDVTQFKEIESYLPPQSRFKILITTRLQYGSQGIQFLPIRSLDPQASLQLLHVNLETDDSRLQNEPESARQLCEWFDHLPLGLAIAGHYLRRKQDLSLLGMLELLEKERLAQEDFASISAAFELSWKDLSPEAKSLSYALSLFALEPIPWCMAEQLLQPQHTIEDLEKLRDDELLRFSFLQRKDTGIYQFHHLTREFVQNKLNRAECSPEAAKDLKESFGHEMAVLLEQILAGEASAMVANIEASIVMTHTEDVVTYLSDRMIEQDLYQCYISLMFLYIYQGDYVRAALKGNQCYDELSRRLGNHHSTVIVTLLILSSIYTSQGKLNQAQQLLLDILEQGSEVLSEDEGFRASVLLDLGSIQAAQGEYEAAEQNCRESLEIRKQLCGDAAVSVATSYCALAEVCRVRGRYAEAEDLYQRAFAIYEETTADELQREQVPASNILNALALLCLEQGRVQEAEEVGEKAMDIVKDILGTEHPVYAARISTLAQIYTVKGDHQRAENYCEQAIKINQGKGNTISLDHSRSLSILASLYSVQGRYDDAGELYDDALKILQQLFKGEHEQVAEVLVALAVNAIAQGSLQSAEPILAQGKKMYRSTIGTAHPRYGELLCVLADVRFRQGLMDEAEQLLQEGVEVMTRAFGDCHPRVGDKLALLAVFLTGQDRPQEAEPLFQKSLEINKEVFGDSNPNVCEYMLFIAEFKRSNGHAQEADELYAEAIGIYQQERDKKINPDFSEGLLKLIELYESQGRYDQVESLYDRLLKISRQLLGENHPTVVKLLTNLAKIYTDQLKYEQATPLYEAALRIRQQIFDLNHPSIVTNLINLTYNYQSLNRFEEAKQRCVDAITISTKMDGSSDSQVSRLQKVLVSIDRALEKYQDIRGIPSKPQPSIESSAVSLSPATPSLETSGPPEDQTVLDRTVKEQSAALKRQQEKIKQLDQQQKQLEAELEQLQSAQEQIEATLQNHRQNHTSRQAMLQPVAEQLLSLVKAERTALSEPLKLVLEDLQQQQEDYQHAWEELQTAIREFNQYKEETNEIRVHLSSHYKSDQTLGAILTPVDHAKIDHLLQTVQAHLVEVDQELKQALVCHEQSKQKNILIF